MKNNRHVLACDLKDDPDLIDEYIRYHKSENVWPEIKQSLYDAGILNMEIYLIGNRIVLIMEVSEDFSLERKKQMDNANEKVQAWEAKMWKYQQELPWAEKGVKWVPMDKIFELD